MGLSAVCAYNLSTAEEVFSRGKYMQSTTVEQSHTKWVRYNGAVPSPRPGAVSGRGRAVWAGAGPQGRAGRRPFRAGSAELKTSGNRSV